MLVMNEVMTMKKVFLIAIVLFCLFTINAIAFSVNGQDYPLGQSLNQSQINNLDLTQDISLDFDLNRVYVVKNDFKFEFVYSFFALRQNQYIVVEKTKTLSYSVKKWINCNLINNSNYCALEVYSELNPQLVFFKNLKIERLKKYQIILTTIPETNIFGFHWGVVLE